MSYPEEAGYKAEIRDSSPFESKLNTLESSCRAVCESVEKLLLKLEPVSVQSSDRAKRDEAPLAEAASQFEHKIQGVSYTLDILRLRVIEAIEGLRI